ncbi:MAG: hypothetical protein EOM85_01940 [Candidatus Moranbacteria bacterium]|nr:hypothetical protein [Candidatus Moranbacteria bacterium]
MSKKFLAGVIAVAGLAFAVSVSAAYDFGTTTLKVGSKGAAVMAVQTVVGATPVDGVFGPMTKAKVMAWQAANGLTADGVFGPASKAKANATVVTPTTPTTPTTPSTLKGGAGDSSISAYSTGLKKDIKEGDEDVKVLGAKIEADGSDIAVNSIKVELKGVATSSTKVSKYVESVDIYKGSDKVGSADVSDFSKDGVTYSKSIALDDAVVKEGDKDAFYVVFNAASSIDDKDNGKDIDVSIVSYRFEDATGVVSTTTKKISKTVNLDLSNTSSITMKSSSNNPEKATIKVDDKDTTEDVLALAFKLDVDDDSQDLKLTTLPVVLAFANNSTAAVFAEQVVDSVNVKIDGDEFEAELKADETTNGSGKAIYVADLEDEDITISAGDVVEVKVYISFNGQDDYANSTTVTASVENKASLFTDTDYNEAAEVEIVLEDEDGDSVKLDATKTGGVLTLSASPAVITGVTASSKTDNNSKIATYTFKFTAEADGSDVTLTSSTIVVSGTKMDKASFNIIKNSGTATTSGDGYKVEDGNKATFTVTYTLAGATSGVGAGTYSATLDSIDGVQIDETAGPETIVAA